jgi:hypothetical protein
MSNTVKVLEVTDVTLTIYKSNPPILGIFAEGVVLTSGYQNPKLIPYVYIAPPEDGIWDFDFVADQPEGPAKQVLTPILATFLWSDFHENIKGVRIHGVVNSIERKISEHREKELRSTFVKNSEEIGV